jgi:hypothetical protein
MTTHDISLVLAAFLVAFFAAHYLRRLPARRRVNNLVDHLVLNLAGTSTLVLYRGKAAWADRNAAVTLNLKPAYNTSSEITVYWSDDHLKISVPTTEVKQLITAAMTGHPCADSVTVINENIASIAAD